MQDRWLSVDEIAEYLGVSKDTVYAWVTRKDMPGHRVGRFWKFKKTEVDDWIRGGGAGEHKGAVRADDKSQPPDLFRLAEIDPCCE